MAATISSHPPIVNLTRTSIVYLVDMILWSFVQAFGTLPAIRLFGAYPTFGSDILSICIGTSIVQFHLLWLLLLGFLLGNAKGLKLWVFSQAVLLLFPFNFHLLRVTMVLAGITTGVRLAVFAILGFYRVLSIIIVCEDVRALMTIVPVPAAERKGEEIV